jgi:hypothetical protein
MAERVNIVEIPGGKGYTDYRPRRGDADDSRVAIPTTDGSGS